MWTRFSSQSVGEVEKSCGSMSHYSLGEVTNKLEVAKVSKHLLLQVAEKPKK